MSTTDQESPGDHDRPPRQTVTLSDKKPTDPRQIRDRPRQTGDMFPQPRRVGGCATADIWETQARGAGAVARGA